MKLLGQDVLLRRAGRKQNMKVRVHQDKGVGGEVGFELHVAQGLTEQAPALGHERCPPRPIAQSGIQMKKT